MKIAYSGISGKIGYFINEYRSTTSCVLDRSVFNWQDRNTYTLLNSYDRVFLSFPVNKLDILQLLPELVKNLRRGQTIVKFGSLGPQRVIHDLIDSEIRKHCNLISLQLAPTMSSLLSEQVAGSVLYDYRYGLPAPYVSTHAAAEIAVKATEVGVDSDVINVTGPENLDITQVLELLSKYYNLAILPLDGKTFVNSYVCSEEIKNKLCNLYDEYKVQYPAVSTDLERNGIVNQSLRTWLASNLKHGIKL